MLIKANEAGAKLARLDPDVRLYLFGGPDEAASSALRNLVVAQIGLNAERVELTPARIKEDPALLADEAASISLFGCLRWVSMSITMGSGDELQTAIENLFAAPRAGNPVIITVSGLSAKSRLTQLVERDARAIAVISYPPELRDAGPLIESLAKPLGLDIVEQASRAIAKATGADRGLMAREIEKLALYLDAAPGKAVRATLVDWQAIGAGVEDDDLSPLINAAFGGQVAALPAHLADLDSGGALDIQLVRRLAARARLLARLRVDVEGGMRPANVIAAQGKAIFWKEKEATQRQLGLWDAPRLARAIDRLHTLESDLKTRDNPGAILIRQAVMELARAVAR